ncbi:hypothetical protein AGLY_015423 [Aphis glycines]|uniref:Uncharacterized protein n=1 Tax=Aphis glycines TaxID=307491 RepID=A0A6G0T1A1_APHGL|nr:hypothetical protein AGLY_015423 [Aphis glycines]
MCQIPSKDILFLCLLLNSSILYCYDIIIIIIIALYYIIYIKTIISRILIIFFFNYYKLQYNYVFLIPFFPISIINLSFIFIYHSKVYIIIIIEHIECLILHFLRPKTNGVSSAIIHFVFMFTTVQKCFYFQVSVLISLHLLISIVDDNNMSIVKSRSTFYILMYVIILSTTKFASATN